MAIMTRERETGGDAGLARHVIGNALVVYPAGNMTREAQELALNVAADAENDLVVVDLPMSSSLAMWESVAQVLPKRRRGVRLVIGGRSRETTALAGHWLAERLKRTVYVPDGTVVRGAGGSLFVHSGQGSGWMRCSPGKPPKFDAKRFPQPPWDSSVVPENFPTSARGMAEPVPSGIWIRPIGDDPGLRAHRQRLVEVMPCQPGFVSVVLGSPGGVPLSQHDVVLVWRQLPDHVRERVRFVQYGPMSVPRGRLGQAIADELGQEVVFFTGMPIGPAVAPEIFTVRQDGSLGWHAYAREMRYRPLSSEGDRPEAPAVVTHRSPLPGGRQLSPGVYWYSVDAVVEVVQSGLLVRPPAATADIEAIRSIPADPDTHHLMYAADTEDDLDRMQYLASDLAHRLSNSVRPMNRVLRGRALLDELTRPVFSQRAGGFADTVSSAGIFDHSERASIASMPSPAEVTDVIRVVSVPEAEIAAPDRETAGAVPGVPGAVEAPLNARPAPPAVPPAATMPAPMAFDAPVPPPGFTVGAGVPSIAPPPVAPGSGEFRSGHDVAPPVRPSARVPEPAPAATPIPAAAPTPAPAVNPTSAPAPTAVPTRAPAPPPTEAPAPKPSPVLARLQPVPAPEATGLLPARGIEEERAWLRRTLAAEFGVMSNSVARVLSEHPGFQGALSRSSAEVLTDAVAVQLYLTARGKSVDNALRTAAVGPHVPFARCVVSGLSRLPSHRGPVVVTASPTPSQWELYRDHKLVTEWGFLHALTTPPAEHGGEADVLVWSMTARRTKLLEAQNGVQERVLFVPGTSFKVLEMIEPRADGTRGRILLRELTAVEIGEDGRVDPNRISLDELALNSLHRQIERWADAAGSVQVDAAAADRFCALPGLA